MKSLVLNLLRLFAAALCGAVVTVGTAIAALRVAVIIGPRAHGSVAIIVMSFALAVGIFVSRVIYGRMLPISQQRRYWKREVEAALRGQPSQSYPGAHVQTTDEGFVWRHGGRPTRIRWADIRRVTLRMGEATLVSNDAFLLLVTEDGTISVPLSLAYGSLLPRLQSLDGFDNERLIAAMGKTTRGDYVLWAYHRGFTKVPPDSGDA